MKVKIRRDEIKVKLRSVHSRIGQTGPSGPGLTTLGVKGENQFGIGED